MQKDKKHKAAGVEAPKDDAQRIAKYLARAGVASRREAEKLIEAGRIKVNGKTLDTPAFKVTDKDKILFDDKPVAAKHPARLWRYHKPTGLVTTHKDEKGRLTVFDSLPEEIGRVISVGRLDLNSEGLLLLTNDGELARKLEHPKTGFSRRYRARAYGRITQDALDTLQDGIKIDGIMTGPIEAMLDSQKGDNCWVSVTIREGKNREVRRAMEHLGLRVNRLIRVSYGPFMLDTLGAGDVQEVKLKELQTKLGHLMEFPDVPVQDKSQNKANRDRKTSKATSGKAASAKPAPKGRGRFAKAAPKSGKYAPRTHNRAGQSSSKSTQRRGPKTGQRGGPKK